MSISFEQQSQLFLARLSLAQLPSTRAPRIQPIIRSFLLGSLLLLATGCQNPNQYVGKWKGDRDWKQIPTTNELAAKAFAAVDLELKPDGDFVLIDGGIPFTGGWSVSGDSIQLTVKTYFNKSVESQSPEVQNSIEFKVRISQGKLFYRSKSDSVEIPMNREKS